MSINLDRDHWRGLVQQATAILSQSSENPVQLTVIERLTPEQARNDILRLQVNDPSSTYPSTILLKQVNLQDYDPENPISRSAQGLLNEWASLHFLNLLAASPPFFPRFYGGDRDAGFILMEDMAQKPSLRHILFHDNATQAEQALLEVATAYGMLHRLTRNKADLYLNIRADLGPINNQLFEHARFDPSLAARTTLHECFASLHVIPHPLYEPELDALTETMLHADPFCALTHGDTSPENYLSNGSGMSLIDFEFAGYRHAFIDGVYGRMWCLNQIPDSIIAGMEETYRAELARNCLEVTANRQFHRAIYDACAAWALQTLVLYLKAALQKDGWFRYRTSTFRQRILARLKAFLKIVDYAPHVQGLPQTLEAVYAQLGTFWASLAPLSLFPAFQ